MRPLFVILALIISCFSFAQQKQQHNSFVRPLPKPARAVNDFSKLLVPSEKQYLEKELTRYHKASSNAIVIITLDSLTDPKTKKQYTVEEAALLYFNTWGIGDSIKNNGVLLMATLKPRRLRIEVGKGLENILTNNVCQQIMDEKLIPNFKQKLFFTAFKEAVSALEEKLDKGASSSAAISDNSARDASQQPESYAAEDTGSYRAGEGFSWLSIGGTLFIIFVIIFIVARIIKGAAGVFTGNGYQHHRTWFGNSYNNNYHSYNNNQANFNNDSYIASDGGMSSSFDSSPSSSFDSSSSSSSSFSGGSSDGGGASGSW